MKFKHFFAFAAAAISLVSAAWATPKEINLIPQPNQMTVKDGEYTLGKDNKLVFSSNSKEAEAVARFFGKKMQPATGFDFSYGKNGDINLEIKNDKALGDEGYKMTSAQNGITVTANKPAGLFYGMQTLLQLLPPEIKASTEQDAQWSVPYVEITDSPRFGWRGMMLDVSRHWFTKEEVMKYIDELAEYKMNRFHWNLANDQGWRIEIKSMPELTNKGAWRPTRVGQWWSAEDPDPGEARDYGGYYTYEDVREVLAYAAERFVTVVPEVNGPGHSLAALYAYPELNCLHGPKDMHIGNQYNPEESRALCVGQELTYDYYTKIYDEIADLFPSEYIHVGGDECDKNFWKKCPKCNAKMKEIGAGDDYNKLQSYYIQRISGILKAKGKKLIGWDEILEGGLAKEATVMSWRGMQGGIDAAKMGHHVIMTPFDQCYTDLWQGEPSLEPDTYAMNRLRDSYSFEPVPEGIDPELILGGQANLWTESVPTGTGYLRNEPPEGFIQLRAGAGRYRP